MIWMLELFMGLDEFTLVMNIFLNMSEPILSNNYQNSCKGKGGLPLEIRAAILSLYNDFCKRENLSKYLDGSTQNLNETFNGIVYRRPIMVSLISLVWVFKILLPILMIGQMHLQRFLKTQSWSYVTKWWMQHTGCLNHNLKEEKLSDIVERKNRTKILIKT